MQLLPYRNRNLHAFRFWFRIWIQHKMEYKSQKGKKIKIEMTSFWETVLLLRLKRQEFFLLKLLNLVWLRFRPEPEPKFFLKVGTGTLYIVTVPQHWKNAYDFI
jgi:hypothetical protein